jgi:urease accessory protein
MMKSEGERILARWFGAVLLVLLWTQSAFAHPQKGEAVGFLTGFRHPISGFDHVLAMIAVGPWGAQLGSPAIWLLPGAFPMVLAMGGMLGLMGVPLPFTEYGIALSAILLGAAVLFEIRPPLPTASVLGASSRSSTDMHTELSFYQAKTRCSTVSVSSSPPDVCTL